MTPTSELRAQRETMEAWRVVLANEIMSPEFESLRSFEREMMGYNHHWLASCIDALRERIQFREQNGG